MTSFSAFSTIYLAFPVFLRIETNSETRSAKIANFSLFPNLEIVSISTAYSLVFFKTFHVKKPLPY